MALLRLQLNHSDHRPQVHRATAPRDQSPATVRENPTVAVGFFRQSLSPASARPLAPFGLSFHPDLPSATDAFRLWLYPASFR